MNIKVERSTFKVMTKAPCIIRRVGYAIEILSCMINDGFIFFLFKDLFFDIENFA